MSCPEAFRPRIRAAVDSDLDAIVRIHNRARPLLADTVAALRARRTAGVALRDDVPWIRLVAELDGKIVATGRAIEASAGPVAEPGVIYAGLPPDPTVLMRIDPFTTKTFQFAASKPDIAAKKKWTWFIAGAKGIPTR